MSKNKYEIWRKTEDGATKIASLEKNKYTPSINDEKLKGNKTSDEIHVQDKLISGENIKTINHKSLLGSGNINIEGSGGGLVAVEHDNTLTGYGTEEAPLGVDSTKFQSPLVSGTNIKTINNTSLLGEGNIDIQGGSGLSTDVKNALLDCFENVAWATDQGETYYDALYDALYGSKTLVSISAVFNQGQVIIYEDTSLDDLKQYLTVTALYDDSSTATVTNYSLSGTLTVGTSTITVTYEGKTTTFTVVVTATPTLSSIDAVFNQGQAIIYDNASLDDLKQYLTVTATYTDSSTRVVTNYSLSGTLTVGTSTITVTYEEETDTFTVTVTAVPTLVSIDAAYTQSGPVSRRDTLDSLRSDLVVTAIYDDSSTRVVTDYTLSGTLTAGTTSTITVTYEGKTDTFDVIVESVRIPDAYQEVEYVQYDHGTSGSATAEGDIDTNFIPTTTSKMVVTIASTNPTTPSVNLFGLRDGTAGSDKAFRITSFSSAGKLGFMRWGYSNQGISYDTNFHTYVLGEDISTIDGTSYPMTAPKSQTISKSLHIFSEWGGNVWIATAPQKVRDIELYSDNATKVKHYVPCYRISDNMIGFYDLVGQEFVFNSVQTYTTKGADV